MAPDPPSPLTPIPGQVYPTSYAYPRGATESWRNEKPWRPSFPEHLRVFATVSHAHAYGEPCTEGCALLWPEAGR